MTNPTPTNKDVPKRLWIALALGVAMALGLVVVMLWLVRTPVAR
jgi:hypothetical protein